MYGLKRLLAWVTAGAAVLALQSEAGEQVQMDSLLDSKADPMLGVQFKAGYVPVGRKSKMFYWYFPHKEVKKDLPWLIWLTGGPGCASGMAAVQENGPLMIDVTTKKMSLNPWGWNNVGHIVYIDQPVGTGFSVLGDPDDFYAANESVIVQHLREFIAGFLKLFPELVDRPLFVTGESYAGHYIPTFCASLVRQPLDGVNLKGTAIGNGWVYPKLQYLSSPTYGAENGLISIDQVPALNKIFEACGELIDSNHSELAYPIAENAVTAIRGDRNPYDVRIECEVPEDGDCYSFAPVRSFFNDEAVQGRLGVKMPWQDCTAGMEEKMRADVVADVMQDVADIANSGVRVLAYFGTEDLMCNHRGGLNWMLHLDWHGREGFSRATFHQWFYQGQSRGIMKSYKNLAFLEVDDAGHLVPMDQPAAAYGMIEQFVKGTLFSDLSSHEEDARNNAVLPETEKSKARGQPQEEATNLLAEGTRFMAKHAMIMVAA